MIADFLGACRFQKTSLMLHGTHGHPTRAIERSNILIYYIEHRNGTTKRSHPTSVIYNNPTRLAFAELPHKCSTRRLLASGDHARLMSGRRPAGVVVSLLAGPRIPPPSGSYSLSAEGYLSFSECDVSPCSSSSVTDSTAVFLRFYM